jgi:hypothetical protein
MQAASPGDTIMIGPGRYDDFHPLVAPAWTTEAIVPVTKDNLTFIGAGNESTIIGPTEMYLPGGLVHAKAIATVENVHAKFVDIGIENAAHGLYWAYGGVEVEGCRFENYYSGIYMYGQGGGAVTDCEFYTESGSAPNGVVAFSPCGPVSISGCTFSGDETGLYSSGTQGVVVSDCHFSSSRALIFSGSSGTVTNCTTTEGVSQSIWATSGSEVDLFGNQLHGNFASLYVDSWSVVTGNGNIFTGGDIVSTIHVSSQSLMTLNYNHILKSGEFAVTVGQYFYEITTNDLTNNYWGTTDTDLIAEWIWDHNDDTSLRGIIDFLPIADGPVPTDSATLGGIKAMFR